MQNFIISFDKMECVFNNREDFTLQITGKWLF